MIDIIALVIGFTQTFKLVGVKGKYFLMPIAIVLGTLLNMMSTQWTFWQGLEGALLGLAATMIVHLTKEQQDALKSSLEVLKDGKLTPKETESVLNALEKRTTPTAMSSDEQ